MSLGGSVGFGAALALVVVASACSHPAPSALRGPPQDVVRAAPDRTTALGSAHVEVDVGAELQGTGTVDLATDQAQFSFARTGAQAHLGDHFDVVVSGPQVWVKAQGSAGGVPGSTATQPWATGSPQVVTGAVHARVSPLDTLLVRPALGTDLAFLRGAIDVRPYGGEEVRGVSTYRYTLKVDLAQAIVNSPVKDRPALDAAAQAIGPVVWPADVWLDDQGRVRRLQMAEDPYARTTTTKANLLFNQDGNYLALTNIQFYDFGTRAAIFSPPADQVVEARAA